MKLETFFEKFDQFADAPDAAAKMRELVLELAVQGKLVEQKPAEGDGHALLRQIHKKNPTSVTETDVEPVDSELASFPCSWAPSKLGEVAEIIRGVTFPASAKSETRSNGDVACLRTANVQAEIDWDDMIYISPTHVSREDQWVMANDIMISMANSYALVGKVAIVREVPQKATFGAFLAAIRPVVIEPYFLLYVLRSPRMQAAFRASSSQTTNIANISLGRMRPLPFPLPPLAEQKRIVAKVDELMALCDRLEAQQQRREIRRGEIARASLARFADAPTPANLNFLFHKSYAIPPGDLRKSILTLAVQGKLVPQDPNDEPASDLLSSFRKEQASHWPKKYEEPQGFSDIDLPRLPSGWFWYRAEQICGYITKGTTPAKTKMRLDDGEVPFLKVYNLTFNGKLDFSINPTFVSRATHDTELARSSVAPGDVLMNIVGPPLGKVSIVTAEYPEWNINQAIAVFHPLSGVAGRYLCLCLLQVLELSALVGAETRGSAGQDNISLAQCRGLPIALPPLAEQLRIVAKVDQLMALVDALETQLATSRTLAAQLTEAVVAELTAAA